MNDAQWHRHWAAQHVDAAGNDVETQAQALAKNAERDAERDGFSVDHALREEDCDTLQDFMLKFLRERAGRK